MKTARRKAFAPPPEAQPEERSNEVSPSWRKRFFRAFKTKYHQLYALYLIIGYVLLCSAIWEGSEWYLFPSTNIWANFPSPEDWRYITKFVVGLFMLWIDDFKLFEIHEPNPEEKAAIEQEERRAEEERARRRNHRPKVGKA